MDYITSADLLESMMLPLTPKCCSIRLVRLETAPPSTFHV
ncbi:uncharacterized protein METZ01_LOCUS226148 [marine metagenome]|uniref:Uncharacterized protein n=1 Tax=marine metagenome TaxID=408172 RepID=A0A382GF19_9ZZZZ